MAAGLEGVLTLSSGRRLGWAEYGDRGGRPVFAFHGLPGSRRQRHPDDGIARGLGARMLHLERPGFGVSDPCPGRSLAGWAQDVAQACDLLGVDTMRLAGVSGGGPYALACAAVLGSRVQRVAVINSVGPPEAMRAGGYSALVRLGFALAPRGAWTMRPFAALAGAVARRLPERYFELLGAGLNATDRRVFARREIREMFAEDMSEAFAQSGAAMAQDLTLIASRWDFDPGAIRAPLGLWHGTEDRIVPVAAAQALAASVPHAELHLLRGEGHFLVFERWPEILGWLVQRQ
jgi:pimeloyl-ACP methyl ester carboxylesterase